MRWKKQAYEHHLRYRQQATREPIDISRGFAILLNERLFLGSSSPELAIETDATFLFQENRP